MNPDTGKKLHVLYSVLPSEMSWKEIEGKKFFMQPEGRSK